MTSISIGLVILFMVQAAGCFWLGYVTGYRQQSQKNRRLRR